MKRILPFALVLFVCFPVLAGDIQEPGKIPPPPPPAITTEKTDTADTSDDGLTAALVADIGLWLLTLVSP